MAHTRVPVALILLCMMTMVASQLTPKAQDSLKTRLESLLPQNVSTIEELDSLLQVGVSLKHLGFMQTTKICSLVSDAIPKLEENVESLYLLIQFEEQFECKLGKKDDKIKSVLLNFESDELKDLFHAAQLPSKKSTKAFKESLPEKIKAFLPKFGTDVGLAFKEEDGNFLGLKSAMLIELLGIAAKSSDSIKSEMKSLLSASLPNFWNSGFDDEDVWFIINSEGTHSAQITY